MITCVIISADSRVIHLAQPISKDDRHPFRSQVDVAAQTLHYPFSGNSVVTADPHLREHHGRKHRFRRLSNRCSMILLDEGHDLSAFSLSWIINGIVGIAWGDSTTGLVPVRHHDLPSSAQLGLSAHVSDERRQHLSVYDNYRNRMSGIWVLMMLTIARSFGDRRSIAAAIVMMGGASARARRPL
jgi:hypothetical protein